MGERIVILGGGESGTGAALLAKKAGASVWLSDKQRIQKTYKDILKRENISFEEGGHSEEKVLRADCIIKSPGIPDEVPLIRKATALEIPVISEIEFGFRFCPGRIIAITGSNGKTTTTLLTHHLLQQAGMDVVAGGNLGKSFARILSEGRVYDWYVLEVSSFQLDGIRTFAPEVAVLTTISPDHLDRYGGVYERYIASKFRITGVQSPGGCFLYNADNSVIRQGLKRYPSAARKFSVHASRLTGQVVLREGQVFNLENTALIGRHNAMNATFALEVAKWVGVEDDESLQAGLESFVNAAHRLEKVGQVDGAVYINDSKATNVDACWYALDACSRPIVWIAGGTDKGNDYAPLLELAEKKVKALICLGVDNEKLKKAFGGLEIPIAEATSAAEAVEKAHQWAEKGDTVLLSPACASFDLFANYEDRGHQFSAAVKALL